MFKMKDDPRVTKIGKFIRKHSIDEFPQFLNVFLGQMSVVGPRPPLPNEVAEYTEVRPAAPGREARDHRLVAGDGAQLDRVRRHGPPGPGVHRQARFYH